MITKRKQSAIAIAIAWPETWCKQPGAWYEWITTGLGISKNNYYKLGHAALILVDCLKEECFYFDFGRYHAPFQHGRVRSALTDPDIMVRTKPKLSDDGSTLLNYREILTELQHNPACHGDGKLHASYAAIDFEKAYQKALEMQANSPLPYGPFQFRGTNCSRFVNTVLRAGKPKWKAYFRLNFMVPLTPTPLNNVHAFGNQIIIENLKEKEPICPMNKPSRNRLNSTLPCPEKHPKIPEGVQWLAGEGAGSWFHLERENSLLKVTRYAPSGFKECSSLFSNREALKNPGELQSIKITHPSNCQTITIHSEGRIHRFQKT
ncbi:MAG: DUF6695 family protein [Prolixibacteraceae bacterium]